VPHRAYAFSEIEEHIDAALARNPRTAEVERTDRAVAGH
jgi:hypothetical protein